jgi:hypothetical protein
VFDVGIEEEQEHAHTTNKLALLFFFLYSHRIAHPLIIIMIKYNAVANKTTLLNERVTLPR